MAAGRVVRRRRQQRAEPRQQGPAAAAAARFPGLREGICRSSLDARKPQNPINSEEYQGHLQGVLYST
eukprot:701471-Prorocentrum_minimum.AAC.2